MGEEETQQAEQQRYTFRAPSHHSLQIGEDTYHGGDEVVTSEAIAAGVPNLVPVEGDADNADVSGVDEQSHQVQGTQTAPEVNEEETEDGGEEPESKVSSRRKPR